MEAAEKQKRFENNQSRLGRTERRLGELKRIESRFPWLRLGALVVGLLVGYFAFALLPYLAAAAVAAAAFAGFMIIVVRHRQVIERITRLEGFRRLLASHIARLQLDWEHIPAPAPVAVPTHHPFAADLDITGSRSLHQLLDTSISLGGSQRLADWLLQTTPDPQRIAEHQGLVEELLERPAFCTRLELDGLVTNPQPDQRWDAAALLRWLDSHPINGSLRPMLIILGVLALANISLFLLYMFQLLPPLWIGTLVVYFGLQSMKFREVRARCLAKRTTWPASWGSCA